MWKSVFKLTAATLLYGAIHSLLSSKKVKRKVAQSLGQRQRNAFYRPFYLVQSVLTFGVFGWYASRLPDQTLYEVKGSGKRVMQLGQLTSLGYAVWAAYQVGFADILGLRGLLAWLRDDREIPQEPEAQGPRLCDDDRLKISGPFRYSRHPLNFSPVVIFWLKPKMTVNWAVFSTISTLYLIIGSRHEESRLREAYGEVYDNYQNSGVPFYLPEPNPPSVILSMQNKPFSGSVAESQSK
jgi:methanethiol S-methyltransferase